MRNERILIVEDEGLIALGLEKNVKDFGFECAGRVFTGEEAIQFARESNPDLVLMDIKLAGRMDGIEAGAEITKSQRIPVLYLTSYSDQSTIDRAKATTPYGYLTKPVQQPTLKAMIEVALERSRLEKELRIKEDQLKATAQRLLESNEKWEQFAALAAHELKAPARTAGLYLGLLEREYGSDLDKKAQSYLDFALVESKRLQALLDDLLEYSTVQHGIGKTTSVSLSKVLGDSLAILAPQIEERHVSVTTEELPQVKGNEVQLRRLFLNLLCNALKYNTRKEPTVIIKAKKWGDDLIVSVEDNGIGIAEESRERIFEPFRRGVTQSEYEGTGVGLASCRQIMFNHGGRIWVESQLGKGSTFFLAFPGKIINT